MTPLQPPARDRETCDQMAQAIQKCQKLLADYLVPHSTITDRTLVSQLLAVLDDKDLVLAIKERTE